MEWFAPEEWTRPDAWAARLLFVRALAAIYLIAFVNAALQLRPLLGERGLLPIPRYLRYATMRQQPSVFHLHYSDRFAVGLAWAGALVAAALVLGLPAVLPVWLYLGVWLVVFLLYLSIVNVGQIWYAFGWESILLEAGFFAGFLGPDHVAPPTLAIYLVLWLAFRVEFGAGLIKLRGDSCWRRLTCLEYHHETQPLPSAFSWHAHHLPRWWHKVEVLGNHVTQLILPFGLFGPQPVASISAAAVILTQGWLVATGNFAWLNALTIILVLPALDDAWLSWLPTTAPPLDAVPSWFAWVVAVVFAGVLVLSWWPVRNMASRHQRMNASYNAFHLVGSYGAFGSVTRERYEIIIEGTDEDVSGPSVAWREYGFKGKPGDPRRRPPQVAPYHLRLDWLMWFAAMSPASQHPWFFRLVERLLAGDRAVLKLLPTNPFPDAPPRYIRASLYRYRFTTRHERRTDGSWWVRHRVQTYLGPVALEAAVPGRR